MRALVWCAGLLVCAALPVAARAAGVEKLTDVKFAAREDALEITFTADGPLTPDRLEVGRDESTVLVLGLAGAKVERRWLTFADPAVERTFLYPDGSEAKLRVRLKGPIAPAVLQNVRARAVDGRLVVSVPRDAAVAARWAAPTEAKVEAPAAVAPAKVEAKAEAPAPAKVEAKAEAPAPAKVEAKALAEAPVEAKAAPVAAVEPPKAATPVTGGDGPLTVTPEKAEDRPLADPQEAAPAEGPGLGAVLVSLLLVGGAGFVMWRKARGAKKAGAANQKLIRPLGAHLLGPKHGLLLVDVAGEMVLLSTSEKGVQMLTKIETPAALEAAKAAVAAAPVAAEPTPTPPGTLADRLGRALSKVRAAAQSDEDVSVDELERGFFARADDAVREAAEDDALAALAAQVDDEPEIGAAPRRVGRTPAAGRGRPAAVRPLATPIPVAAPSPAARNPAREQHLAADILEKIRQLQGA